MIGKKNQLQITYFSYKNWLQITIFLLMDITKTTYRHNTTCDFSIFSHKMTINVHTNVKPNPYINILSVFNFHLFGPCNKSYYFHNDTWTQKEIHKKSKQTNDQTFFSSFLFPYSFQ
jgi:hypothetical protein